jgi:hypothetical protein
VSYLAMGLPAMAAGFLVSRGSALLATAQNFGALVAMLSSLALVGMLSGRLSAATRK